jgi:hypothetical protein
MKLFKTSGGMIRFVLWAIVILVAAIMFGIIEIFK